MFHAVNNIAFIDPYGKPIEELSTFDKRWMKHQQEVQEQARQYLEQRAAKKQIDSMVHVAIEKALSDILK